MKKSIVYINGIKASKKDLARLESYLKAGKGKAYGKTTKKGNLAYRTEF
jgi:hypothetical protein